MHDKFLSRICSCERTFLRNANPALFLVLGCNAKAFRLTAYRIKMVAVSVGAFGAVKFSVKCDGKISKSTRYHLTSIEQGSLFADALASACA